MLVFESWEQSRPARRIDRFADLRLDVLSFAFALLVNRLSNRAVNGAMNSMLPPLALQSLHAMAELPYTLKFLGSLVLADFTARSTSTTCSGARTPGTTRSSACTGSRASARASATR